jgi:hypothetical protein
VVGAASGGGGRQLAVRGGRTQWRGAWGVVKSVEERLERVVHDGSVAVGIEQGRAARRGQRSCRGWSWKGCRGAPARGGARGGDGREGGGRRRRHSVDRGAVVAVGLVRGENRDGA